MTMPPRTTTATATATALRRRAALLTWMSTLGLLLAAGCAPEEPGLRELPAQPTYHADIAPILERRCVARHQAGGLAPFSLQRFEQVAPMARSVAAAVTSRRMPPLPAAQGTPAGAGEDECPPIEDPRVMPDLEREAVARWVEQGAVEGAPVAAPPP